MYFWGAVVIFCSSFPHPEIRSSVGSFDVVNEILDKSDFILRVNYLQPWRDHFNQKYQVKGHNVNLKQAIYKKIAKRNNGSKNNFITCRWLYSSSVYTSAPVTRWNLQWRACLEDWFFLNFSTLGACLTQHSSMPLMHFTADWPSSYDLPLSSSIRLSMENNFCISHEFNFLRCWTYRLGKDSRWLLHSRCCHEYCLLWCHWTWQERGHWYSFGTLTTVAWLKNIKYLY